MHEIFLYFYLRCTISCASVSKKSFQVLYLDLILFCIQKLGLDGSLLGSHVPFLGYRVPIHMQLSMQPLKRLILISTVLVCFQTMLCLNCKPGLCNSFSDVVLIPPLLTGLFLFSLWINCGPLGIYVFCPQKKTVFWSKVRT